MIEEISLGISLVAIILAIYALFLIKKVPDETLDQLELVLDEQFKPMQTKVNRAMTIKNIDAVERQQEQALDRRLAMDLVDMQDPLIQSALDLFPNVKEYVNKNPQLIMKLLPRIQALQGIEGFKPLDLLKPDKDKQDTDPRFRY